MIRTKNFDNKHEFFLIKPRLMVRGLLKGLTYNYLEGKRRGWRSNKEEEKTNKTKIFFSLQEDASLENVLKRMKNSIFCSNDSAPLAWSSGIVSDCGDCTLGCEITSRQRIEW
jgi:hypothetical protein